MAAALARPARGLQRCQQAASAVWPHAAPWSAPLLGPSLHWQQLPPPARCAWPPDPWSRDPARGVARVRINRTTGVVAVKQMAPKTEWQRAAEREFLFQRSQVPMDAYINGLTADDVRHLSPDMQHCLTLKCAGIEDHSKYRIRELVRKFQRHPTDSSSHAVRIAVLTEKILRLRAHMLRHPKHLEPKRPIAIRISDRQRAMKALYKADYPLYRHVCQELGIRCVRFAIPDSRNPSQQAAPLATDGDRAKWLVRQRLYRWRYAPRKLREPGNFRVIRYTRHPQEPVPESHGKPQPTPQQISRAFPYGVRQERVEGRQVVHKPTAPGKGYWPASRGRKGGGPALEP